MSILIRNKIIVQFICIFYDCMSSNSCNGLVNLTFNGPQNFKAHDLFH